MRNMEIVEWSFQKIGIVSVPATDREQCCCGSGRFLGGELFRGTERRAHYRKSLTSHDDGSNNESVNVRGGVENNLDERLGRRKKGIDGA